MITASSPRARASARSAAARLALLLALLGLLVAVATPARAAGLGWQPTVDLASPEDGAANLPSLAVDADGTTYAAWVRAATSGGPSLVQIASKPRHGAWTRGETISRDVTGETGSRVSEAPRVAVRDGVVAVAWLQTAPSSTRSSSAETWAAVRAASGTWSAPRSLSTVGTDESPRPASDAVVGVGPDGTATVAWLDDGGTAVVSREGRPDGSWGVPQRVASAADDFFAGYLDLGVAADGGQTLTWQDSGDDGVPGIFAAGRSGAGGAWGAATMLSGPGRYSLFPKVAVAPDGTADVVWATRIQEQSAFANYEVQTAHGAGAGGGWDATRVLSAPGGDANGRGTSKSPVAAVDASGTLTVAWVRSEGANADLVPDRVQVRTRLAGGAWSAPQDVWSGLRNPTLRKVGLAAGPDGQATVAVSGYTTDVGAAAGPRSVRVLRRETPDGPWSAERELSEGRVGSSTVVSWEPSVVADGRGNVDVAWHSPDRTGEVGVQAASFLTADAVPEPTPVDPGADPPVVPDGAGIGAPPVVPEPTSRPVLPGTARSWRDWQRRRFVATRGLLVDFTARPGAQAGIVVRRGRTIVARVARVRVGADGRVKRRVRLTAAGRRSILRARGTVWLRARATVEGRVAAAGVRLR